ncbi:MAG: hypothetical protein ACFE0I_08300 [Elainellaceae cyanobacterium]
MYLRFKLVKSALGGVIVAPLIGASVAIASPEPSYRNAEPRHTRVQALTNIGKKWQIALSSSSPPRPINPDSEAPPSESIVDSYFRLAFDAAMNDTDFDTAILNYQRAGELVTTECEVSYAQAAERAAREARQAVHEGRRNPTRSFWNRLQELTESLPCVYIELDRPLR